MLGTSQRSNQLSNRQNWFKTKISSRKKACWEIVDRPKVGPALVQSPISLEIDGLSCERVVKTFQTSLRRNKGLRPVRDFSPGMLLYGKLFLFRTNFPPLPRVAMFCDVITCKPYYVDLIFLLSDSNLRGALLLAGHEEKINGASQRQIVV